MSGWAAVGTDRQALERLPRPGKGGLGGLTAGVASNFRMRKSSAAEPAHRVALAASADVFPEGDALLRRICAQPGELIPPCNPRHGLAFLPALGRRM